MIESLLISLADCLISVSIKNMDFQWSPDFASCLVTVVSLSDGFWWVSGQSMAPSCSNPNTVSLLWVILSAGWITGVFQ